MKLVVGLVLFLVGINVGFVTAGLMHAAKGALSHSARSAWIETFSPPFE